jgi:hypothetical protein
MKREELFMNKYTAIANTNEFGLTRGSKYMLENPKTGSVYVHNSKGEYLTYCRKDSFDNWKLINK